MIQMLMSALWKALSGCIRTHSRRLVFISSGDSDSSTRIDYQTTADMKSTSLVCGLNCKSFLSIP